MATERNEIDDKQRKRIHQRDQKACRKCGGTQKLEVHHIVPLTEHGTNTDDNLITLCVYCHREWETFTIKLVIPFEQWLQLPPYSVLVRAFAHEELWSDTITAKDARNGILQAYQLKRQFQKEEE